MSTYDLLQLTTPVDAPGQPQSQPDCPLCAGSKNKSKSVRRELRYDWVLDRPTHDGDRVCSPSCAFTASGAYSCVPGRASGSSICAQKAKRR
jgi:hypothetical protein